MAKPKVAVIGLKGLPAHGGAATVGQKIVDELIEKVDFTLYATAANTSFRSYKGVKQVIIPKFGNGGINTLLYYILSAFHALLFGKFKVVHLHHYSSGFIAPLLKIRFKVVSTFHGIPRTADPKFGAATNTFLRKNLDWSVKFCERIISVSEPDLNDLKAHYTLHAHKFEFIPNGMETVEIPEVKASSHWVFAAGRIYDIKGLHLILDAMHKMKNPPKLQVIGNLNHSSLYKKEILKLAEGLEVEFIGLIKKKEELFKLIKAGSCFIFPSLTEAMSMMLLEVASLKVPIIASDIPANQAVFNTTEVTFFKSGSVNDLQQKLELFHTSPETFKQKVDNAFVKLTEKHNWQKIAESYFQLYTRV